MAKGTAPWKSREESGPGDKTPCIVLTFPLKRTESIIHYDKLIRPMTPSSPRKPTGPTAEPAPWGTTEGSAGRRLLHLQRHGHGMVPLQMTRQAQPGYKRVRTKATGMDTTETSDSHQDSREEMPLAWLFLSLQCIRKKLGLRTWMCHESILLYSTQELHYCFPCFYIPSSPP